jgi:hypothetical protein
VVSRRADILPQPYLEARAKHDFKNSLDKLDDLNYVVEGMIASEDYPDLVGTYWKAFAAIDLSTALLLELEQ